MKKLLLILTLSFICFKTQAQTDSVKKAITDTTQVTFTRVYNDVSASISGLASALKVGATHVYEVLVKQQHVISITWLLVYLILIIPIGFLLRNTKRFYKRVRTKDDPWYNDDLEDHESQILYIIITIILSIVLIVTCCNTIESVITGLLNPEYGAMKDIVNMIHK